MLGDLWIPAQRGQAIAIYSLAPLLGPVIAPVAGGWIAEKSTWRWVFRSTTIVAAAIQIAGFFLLQESEKFIFKAKARPSLDVLPPDQHSHLSSWSGRRKESELEWTQERLNVEPFALRLRFRTGSESIHV